MHPTSRWVLTPQPVKVLPDHLCSHSNLDSREGLSCLPTKFCSFSQNPPLQWYPQGQVRTPDHSTKGHVTSGPGSISNHPLPISCLAFLSHTSSTSENKSHPVPPIPGVTSQSSVHPKAGVTFSRQCLLTQALGADLRPHPIPDSGPHHTLTTWHGVRRSLIILLVLKSE